MTDDDRDLMAGEYVLGTLGRSEREQARALAARDPDFARAVRSWREKLTPLDEAIPPEAPPPTLWSAIERSLEGLRAASPTNSEHAGDQVVVLLRKKLVRWRFAALAAAAAAIIFAVVALLPILQPPGGVRYVAVLNGEEGRPGFVVTAHMKPPRLVVRSLGMTAPAAKSYELWLIPPGEKPPSTLGLIARREIEKLDMPVELDAAAIAEGVKLAVSLEPEGGAPSGRSMGPIVFAGELIRQVN